MRVWGCEGVRGRRGDEVYSTPLKKESHNTRHTSSNYIIGIRKYNYKVKPTYL